jgi:hypothetical protein
VAIQERHDAIAFGDCQRPARAEIVLNVDNQQRGTHGVAKIIMSRRGLSRVRLVDLSPVARSASPSAEYNDAQTG